MRWKVYTYHTDIKRLSGPVFIDNTPDLLPEVGDRVALSTAHGVVVSRKRIQVTDIDGKVVEEPYGLIFLEYCPSLDD